MFFQQQSFVCQCGVHRLGLVNIQDMSLGGFDMGDEMNTILVTSFCQMDFVARPYAAAFVTIAGVWVIRGVIPLTRWWQVFGGTQPYASLINEVLVYWAIRRGRHPMTTYREASLLKKQRGRCPICRSVFDVQDAIEHDHIWPKAKGGRNVYSNLQLVHRSCHHLETRWDGQGVCPIRPWRGEMIGEKPCEGKLSRTVLKAGGVS